MSESCIVSIHTQFATSISSSFKWKTVGETRLSTVSLWVMHIGGIATARTVWFLIAVSTVYGVIIGIGLVPWRVPFTSGVITAFRECPATTMVVGVVTMDATSLICVPRVVCYSLAKLTASSAEMRRMCVYVWVRTWHAEPDFLLIRNRFWVIQGH